MRALKEKSDKAVLITYEQACQRYYLGMNTKRHEPVAIKLEQTKTKHPQLLYESKLYTALQGGGTILNIIISL